MEHLAQRQQACNCRSRIERRSRAMPRFQTVRDPLEASGIPGPVVRKPANSSTAAMTPVWLTAI